MKEMETEMKKKESLIERRARETFGRSIQELLEEIKALLRIQIGITKHLFNSRSFYYISSVICSCNCIRQVAVTLILDFKFLLKYNRRGIYSL